MNLSNRVRPEDLPIESLKAISSRQKTYIDEFEFYQQEDGTIVAFYGSDKLATWNGEQWVQS
jgi:hypothetical protein